MADETADKENISIIFFDPNNQTDDFKKQLNQINDDVIFYTDLESCIHFIQSIEKQKVFLITSSQILSHIIHLQQIDCVFIFYLNNDSYEYSLLESTKVIGIYHNLHLLCSSIQEQIYLINKQFYLWTFFDQDQYTNKDLSKQANHFLWIQLFHRALLHLPHDQQAKEQMISAYIHHYQDNIEELQLFKKFEQKYQAKEALSCFIKSSFLQKMINKALQTKDIDLLYTLRYFLLDLIENLAHQHQQMIQSNEEKLILYQEMKLSNDESNQFHPPYQRARTIFEKCSLSNNTNIITCLHNIGKHFRN